MSFLFEIVLGEVFGTIVTAIGILPGVHVRLLTLQDRHAHQTHTSRKSEAGAPSEMELVRTVHNHVLPPEPGTDILVARTMVIADSVKNFAYPIHDPLNKRFRRLREICCHSSFMPGTFNQ